MAWTEEEILEATEEQLSNVPNEQLAAALLNAIRFEPRRKIMAEVQRRTAARDLARPFDPRVDVSADAQFLWKRGWSTSLTLPEYGRLVIRPEEQMARRSWRQFPGAWRVLTKILESTRAPLVPSGLLSMNS